MRSNLLVWAAAAAMGGTVGVMREVHNPARAPLAGEIAPVVAAAPQHRGTALQAARAVLSSVGIEDAAHASQVQTALEALGDQVREQSDPNALKLAFRAYFAFKSAHPEQVKKPWLYFVDYGLGNDTPRGYVFDMAALKVVDGPFTVAAGRGSPVDGHGVPTRFSNRSGSASTSLGLFLAQETYAFAGHSAGSLYHSIGLRLQGVSGHFNNTARARGVVVHGAPYVTARRAGRSEGCPAMEPARAREILPQLKGGLVFLFSPRDRTWVTHDPWANDSSAEQIGG